MKPFFTLLFLTVFALQSNAQRGNAGKNVQRVRAAKIGYITNRLALTDQQAEAFWPVYHRYEDEIRLINRRAFKELQGRRQTAVEGDQAALRSIDTRLETQEKIIEVQRKYKSDFLRVISANQVLSLYDAEREFQRMVIQRVRQQRNQRSR